MSSTYVEAAEVKTPFDWKRVFFLCLGVALFSIIYYAPPWPDAIDPMGKHFTLSPEGKGALALFALAATWWIFEVLPIGVTGIAIGVVQAMFLIRKPEVAFKDFMDPSVLFIFGSIVIGLVFTKSGLTKRMAYKMLSIVGEKTSMIYLGCFVMTVVLTHLMAHTAVAATMFPLLMAINALYSDDDKPTKFGKGLFIGMAYVAGAGSIITLLGSARAAVAIAFFKEMTGKEISFFELTYYLFPLGWLMVFLIWGMMMVLCKPEKAVIPGLKERAKRMYTELGGWSRNEILTLVIVLSVIVLIAAKNWVPALKTIDKTAILLVLDPAVLRPQYPEGRGSRGYPLEYHPALRWGDVHRFLSLADPCRRMAGGQLAGLVQGGPGRCLYPRHRLLRHDHDQLHHERGGDRHLAAGGSGHRPVSRRGRRGHLLLLAGDCRYAVLPADRCRPERHRLRLEAVHRR